MNNADANLALLLLDRLDVSADDDERVNQITGIVRGMSSDRVVQAAKIARLSAALDETLAQLEAERARNAALNDGDVYMLMGHAMILADSGDTDMPKAIFDLAARIGSTIDPAIASRVREVANENGLGSPPLDIIPKDAP